jgi:hypothetical protein
VAIVSLLAEDLDVTTLWENELLGPLAHHYDRAQTLRDTLRGYFENR